MSKTIELLFPDFCNIYAESYSVEYLEKCSDEITVIRTMNHDKPAFVDGKVDMIYLGCSSERKQEQIIELLRPYTDRIKELIASGTIFLITGNAIEIFGTEIRDDERIIPALGLYDFYSVRKMHDERHNSQYVGTFRDTDGTELTLLGHRSQFSFAYGDFDQKPFLDIEIGIGMNPETKLEGIRDNNFFATYSLGPYMILNPPFAKYLLNKMGIKSDLAFEKEAIESYNYRLNELRRTLG